MSRVQRKKQKSYIVSVLYLSYFTEKAIYFTDGGLIPPGNTVLAILLITTLKMILVQEGKK